MAFQDNIRYGVNTQGDRFAGAGGAAEQAFIEGRERSRIENERNKLAADKEREELDAVYGELYVPPTGSASYDAGVEMMGREWKSEFAALNASKNNIPPEEYVAKKHEILNRAKELKAGQDALNQSHQLFMKATEEDQVSASTPAKTKLFYQALQDGKVQIQNVDGVPTLVGEVADGEPVQIPMAALANGTAGLKFNQKVDSNGMVDTIAKTLEGYKTTIATQNGLALGNVGWDQIQDRAAHDIEQMLSSKSTLQAIAADDLGLNSEDIAELSDEELKSEVSNHLLNKVQQEYFPVQKIDKFTGLTEAQSESIRLQEERLNRGLNQQGQPNASLLKHQQQQQILADTNNVINSALQPTGTNNFNAEALNAIPGVSSARNFRVGAGIVVKLEDGRKLEINPNDPQSVAAFKLALGIPSNFGSEVQSAQPTQQTEQKPQGTIEDIKF